VPTGAYESERLIEFDAVGAVDDINYSSSIKVQYSLHISILYSFFSFFSIVKECLIVYVTEDRTLYK